MESKFTLPTKMGENRLFTNINYVGLYRAITTENQ